MDTDGTISLLRGVSKGKSFGEFKPSLMHIDLFLQFVTPDLSFLLDSVLSCQHVKLLWLHARANLCRFITGLPTKYQRCMASKSGAVVFSH